MGSALEKLEGDRAVVLGAVLPGDVQGLTSGEGLVFGRDGDAVEAFGLRKGGADESHEGGDGGDGELHLDLLFECLCTVCRLSPILVLTAGPVLDIMTKIIDDGVLLDELGL